MYRLGSRPRPAVRTAVRVTVQPTVEAVLRRDGAGTGTPGAATEVTR